MHTFPPDMIPIAAFGDTSLSHLFEEINIKTIEPEVELISINKKARKVKRTFF